MKTYKQEILKALNRSVKEVFNEDIDYFLRPYRKREVADVRLMIYYILRTEVEMTYQEIGRTLGKQHSTIVYGVKQSKNLLMYDKRFAHDYNLLKGKFQKFIAQ